MSLQTRVLVGGACVRAGLRALSPGWSCGCLEHTALRMWVLVTRMWALVTRSSPVLLAG